MKLIRGASRPDGDEDLIYFMGRQRIAPSVEAGVELEWEEDAGDVEYHPGEEKERQKARRDECRRAVDDEEVDVHVQPQDHPHEHKLTSSEPLTFLECMLIAGRAECSDKCVECRKQETDHAIFLEWQMTVDRKVVADPVDCHKEEELHDDRHHHGDCVV